MRALKLMPLVMVVLLFAAAAALPNVKKSPPSDKAAIHATAVDHVDVVIASTIESTSPAIAESAIVRAGPDVEPVIQTITQKIVEPNARDVASLNDTYRKQYVSRSASLANPDRPLRSRPYLL